MVNGERHQGSEQSVAKVLEGPIQACAQRIGFDLVRVHEGAAQMAGQDQHALQERGEDDGNDDQRDDVEDVADHTADQHQRQEGRDGGQRGRDHRRQHPTHPALGREERILAHLMVGHGILADHDGVVHDDAQRHDEREEAHHVDASAGQVEDEKCRHEGHRDPPSDPEGDPTAQEQKEDRHDQDETAGPVRDQQHDAVANQLPGGVVDHQLDPGREQGTRLGQPVVERLGRGERVARLGALQDHLNRRASVHREPQGRVARHTLDLGDIAEL